MKRLSLLSLLLCLLVGSALAATISGTVYYNGTTIPVAGQVITIFDTAGSWNTTATTNSSGVYSATIPTTVPTTGFNSINTSTTACGVYIFHPGPTYTGSSVTSNFYICWGVGTQTLHGTVSLGGATNTGQAKVYLIRKQYDPVLLDTTLTAIDSITTASTGGTFSKTYASIPAGTLFLKAALVPAHPSYASYLPTYYTSALNWSSATALGIVNFTSIATNINMIAGTNPGGPGFIGGSVLLGANKGTGVGDPLSSRILLLTNASTGQGIAYTYSDAAGKFQFPSVPNGTYKLFGDALGKANPALMVTISATQNTVNNIVFEENNKKFEGHIGGVGINSINPLTDVRVFPNPATDYVSVNGLSAIKGSKNIVLTNMTGSVISSQVVTGGDATVATAALPAGIYMLHIQTEAGNANYQIVK